MLTRLKVSGFKNLVDVDIRFGPFTCIAGANGTGKSNLFDAINFLSTLADRSLIEAARSVRGVGERMEDIRNLFHRVGNSYADKMSFEAEMMVLSPAIAPIEKSESAIVNFLRYSLTLAYRTSDRWHSFRSLEILEERLEAIAPEEARAYLIFPREAQAWRRLERASDRETPFVYTDWKDGVRVVRIERGERRGKAISQRADALSRTTLSAIAAAENAAALAARQEMRSWKFLQFEPSAIRQPDGFMAPTKMAENGSHLAATLYHLAGRNEAFANDTYARVSNRLSDLLEDVRSVWVERDDRRELLTLVVEHKDGTIHPARSLSDGTLRFLAIAVLALDWRDRGLICLEEPENHIHPGKIPAVLELLQDIATDAEKKVGEDNPLRQVIVSTHSPAFVQLVPRDSSIFAELKDTFDREGSSFQRANFAHLPDTWRDKIRIAP